MSVIKNVNIAFVRRHATAGGQTKSEEFNDMLDEIAHDLAQVKKAVNGPIFGTLRGLPLGLEDARFSLTSDQDAPALGLDGKRMFMDGDTNANLDEGFYWESTIERPKTLKEIIESLRTLIGNVSAASATGAIGAGLPTGVGLNDVYENTTVPQTIHTDNGPLTIRGDTNLPILRVLDEQQNLSILTITDPGTVNVKLGSTGAGFNIQSAAGVQRYTVTEAGNHTFRLGANKFFNVLDSDGGCLFRLQETGEVGLCSGGATPLTFYGDGSNLTGLGGGTVEGTFACTSNEQPNDAVYISAPNTATRADATSIATAPVIGFITDKDGDTSCTVRFVGEVDGFNTPTLSPGKIYYLEVNPSLPGSITDNGVFTAAGNVTQVVGVAKNSTTLILNPSMDFTVVQD